MNYIPFPADYSKHREAKFCRISRKVSAAILTLCKWLIFLLSFLVSNLNSSDPELEEFLYKLCHNSCNFCPFGVQCPPKPWRVRGLKKSQSASTLVTFSSKLTLTLTLSDGGCNFFLKNMSFLAEL
jgi:hypothetical protein